MIKVKTCASRYLTLLEATNLHTILRLPTGVFYANGIKINVLFFDKYPAQEEAITKNVWIYDYRTNGHHAFKRKPIKLEHLQEFITCYNANNIHERIETYDPEDLVSIISKLG